MMMGGQQQQQQQQQVDNVVVVENHSEVETIEICYYSLRSMMTLFLQWLSSWQLL